MLAAGEDHARDPEEDDVVAGDEHVRRIEVVQIRRLVRPAERGERPERAGEPGVEHVARRGGCSWSGTHFGHSQASVRETVDLAAVAAVPHGDLMAPPELAGDAPVAHAVHPVEIRLGEAIRHELDLAVFHNAWMASFARGCIFTNHWSRSQAAPHRCGSGSRCRHCGRTARPGHEIALLLELLRRWPCGPRSGPCRPTCSRR